MAENKKMTMISVIMPAYNEEKYIEKALDSVCTQEGDFSIEKAESKFHQKTFDLFSNPPYNKEV